MSPFPPDSSGNLFAANYNNSTIARFDASDNFLGAITSNVSFPEGIAFDSTGTLYSANFDGQIRRYDASGNYLGTFPVVSAYSWLAIVPAVVPEPSTYVLGTLAVGVIAVMARRKAKPRAVNG